ncbi:DUF305 domain-containing protein [Paraurantiacibacter namhicola]|uniref:DUF305 domain-containing protein n=1 Tax=Paraurantiacibacter namhicola TaxID=645517 RepID=A0A1C7D5U2_9SPHN|nr:DUF305 domain-containing protein [Paraurantiacibacter namhicola]ANU06722.1 hypothetical protein A6F65_00397 [Paraurantiacibacter namhicola]
MHKSVFLMATMLATTAPVAAQEVPIILPGAPGEAPRVVSSEEAIALADTRYSPADVAFMQGMIVHHQQALDMAQLAKGRTSNDAVLKIADRIEATQADEMKFMRGWLEARNIEVMPMGMGHAHHDHMMKGMATPEQMAQLAASSGTEFDRLFLQLMTAHHLGAVDMVEELHKQPGSAYDPVMYEFTNEVLGDQKSEIDRMNAIAATLSQDPRATLGAGFRDADEAILHMRKVAVMPKPAGFFDPANPAQLRPLVEKDEEEAETETSMSEAEEDAEADKPQFGKRGSLLSFSFTDMAFAGDVMVVGSYHGFNAYRLGADGVPQLVSSVVCPGGQGDVSIAGDLLVMSVESSQGRKDCGLQGVTDKVSEERFRGLRIFDISDLTRPRQVGQVQTCRGSHTHSIVRADAERLVVYNSGSSYVRDEEELAGCIETAGDGTALFSIDVIEIPVSDPASARVVEKPRVFATDGEIAGLWRGGDHGRDTQRTSVTNHCHDITVFPAKNIAAGACSGNGIVLDISDPLRPKRIDDVTDKGFAYWHSATFNNDGTKVLFTDEWGGGGRPRCQAGDPQNWGADAFYAFVDGKLEYRGMYKLPAPQSDKENCVAHNGSIVPVPGRDIFVQAWYQGGISVIDFTDATNPVEIAYFDRGPVDKDQLVTGGYWSAYWYKGRIYATEISRGLDVFALEPSEFLTAEEIAAAENAEYAGDVFNPQTQTQVTWPEEYIEAAERSRAGG